MTRIGYKVARRTTPGHFASILAPVPLAYQLNATSIPDEDGGPICLFADMDSAVGWMSRRSQIAQAPPACVLRCEYEPWDKKLPRDTADSSRLVLRERADGFFYESQPYLVWHGCACTSGRLPRRTRLAKSITPLEVVYEAR